MITNSLGGTWEDLLEQHHTNLATNVRDDSPLGKKQPSCVG